MSSRDISQKSIQQPAFRGVFSDDDNDEIYNPYDWREATKQFSNGVPRFVSFFRNFFCLELFSSQLSY